MHHVKGGHFKNPAFYIISWSRLVSVLSPEERETSLCGASGFSANVTSLNSMLVCQVWLECVEWSTICVYKALYGLGWRTARNRHPCSIFSKSPSSTFALFKKIFLSLPLYSLGEKYRYRQLNLLSFLLGFQTNSGWDTKLRCHPLLWK